MLKLVTVLGDSLYEETKCTSPFASTSSVDQIHLVEINEEIPIIYINKGIRVCA